MKVKKIASILLMTAMVAESTYTYAAVTPSPTPAPASVERDGHILYRELTEEEIAEGYTYGGDGYIVPPFGTEIITPALVKSSTITDVPATNPVPFGQNTHPDYIAPVPVVLTPDEIAYMDTLSGRDWNDEEIKFMATKGRPYTRQSDIQAFEAANIAAGVPALAIWDSSTGVGRITLDGKEVYLGESKAEVEARFGQPSRIEVGYLSGNCYIYEAPEGSFFFEYAKNGRLSVIQVQIPGFQYNGHVIGEQIDRNIQLKPGEKWAPSMGNDQLQCSGSFDFSNNLGTMYSVTSNFWGLMGQSFTTLRLTLTAFGTDGKGWSGDLQ